MPTSRRWLSLFTAQGDPGKPAGGAFTRIPVSRMMANCAASVGASTAATASNGGRNSLSVCSVE
jgi:hypothetical protein